MVFGGGGGGRAVISPTADLGVWFLFFFAFFVVVVFWCLLVLRAARHAPKWPEKWNRTRGSRRADEDVRRSGDPPGPAPGPPGARTPRSRPR